MLEELIVSMEEVVKIVVREIAPGRVHHPVAIFDVDVRAVRKRPGRDRE